MSYDRQDEYERIAALTKRVEALERIVRADDTTLLRATKQARKDRIERLEKGDGNEGK